ncbi:hypothetical protein ES332_D07G159600v1 [Gossypium tomentosum]|uniref:Uncharacterized protein n=1 Tax=Gossypium tomentosum TaxID=34277 RepID=A0A5D2KAE3_GOSTO|nr:hypothetical protein ES332_D07G159600v1 [Gossypium tomentosum]
MLKTGIFCIGGHFESCLLFFWFLLSLRTAFTSSLRSISVQWRNLMYVKYFTMLLSAYHISSYRNPYL